MGMVVCDMKSGRLGLYWRSERNNKEMALLVGGMSSDFHGENFSSTFSRMSTASRSDQWMIKLWKFSFVSTVRGGQFTSSSSLECSINSTSTLCRILVPRSGTFH